MTTRDLPRGYEGLLYVVALMVETMVKNKNLVYVTVLLLYVASCVVYQLECNARMCRTEIKIITTYLVITLLYKFYSGGSTEIWQRDRLV